MKAKTRIRRSIRAISPVISVLLMIAIAVAASLIAYAWMMGYIGGTTTKTGKAVLIQSMAADELGNLVVYVQNVGMGAVTVDSVYVGDNLIESGLGIQLLEGETATIPVGYPVSPGDSPKVKVVTTDGTFTESSGTVTPTVNPTTYSITASAGSGGSISPSGSVVVNPGAEQTFDITADTGYHIDDVVVDGGSVGAVPSYTFTNVQADHTISATFAIDTHTITASAGTGGSISPSGSVVVNHGASQGFTITADPNYHILDVLVDGGSVGAVGSYTFTNVVASHTISATFAIDTHTITASAGAGGTISPSGSVVVNHGADQSFTIAADSGYHIDDVVVDGGSVGAVGSYTFTNVVADHTISATFAQDTVSVTFAVDPLGSGTTNPSGIQSYTVGQVVPISVSDTNPGDGRVFCYWSATGSITFANAYVASTTATINSAGTITAHFRIATTMEWDLLTPPSDVEVGQLEQIRGFLYDSRLHWLLGGGLDDELVTIVFIAPNGTQIPFSDTTSPYLLWPGSFDCSITPDVVGTWSVYAQFDGDGTYNASKVGPTTFTVDRMSMSLSCTVSPTTINLGQSVTASGTLTPALSGQTITLTYTKSGLPPVVRTVTTNPSGGYSDTYPPPEAGSWTVQASFAGDANHEPATSPTRSFTVNPKTLFSDNFSGSTWPSEWITRTGSVSRDIWQSSSHPTTGRLGGSEDGTLVLRISTTGYSSIKLNYERMGSDLTGEGNDEHFYIHWSTDNINWNLIEDYTSGSWALNEYNLPAGADNQATLYVRFYLDYESDGWLDSDRGYLDNLAITASAFAP
jgi:hypothetical protein